MNINEKYQDCETCKYDRYSNNICTYCDAGYSKWLGFSYEQALESGVCKLCEHYELHTQQEPCKTCLHQDDHPCFTPDRTVMSKLFPGHIDINKHTIKGILE